MVRVLVVEDDRDSSEVFADVLIEAGFAAERVYNGSEALARLAVEDNFDVILLDMAMPVMDGNAFLSHYTGTISVVVLTGDCRWPTRKCFDLIRKPCDIDLLVAKVQLAADYSRKIRSSRIVLPDSSGNPPGGDGDPRR